MRIRSVLMILAVVLAIILATWAHFEYRVPAEGRAALEPGADVVVRHDSSVSSFTPDVAAAGAPSVISSSNTPTIPSTPRELVELGAQLTLPVQGIVASQLRDTYTELRGARVHEAIDIAAARGTPVLSATNGRLLKLFDSKAGGLMIYATDASERFILLYGHLDAYANGLRDGMRLERGQVIGYVGTTGNAPAGTPHLHFGILRGRPEISWSRGTPINPYPLLISGEMLADE